MLNKQKKTPPDKPFMNLTIEEMSARIRTRDQELNRRNCLLLLIMFAVLGFTFLIGAWTYSEWLVETLRAVGQLAGSLWRLEWLAAAEILFHYKLSFFVLGVVVGFAIFLLITFQIIEMIFDLIWDYVSSFFS